jgi:nucleotide-binding universal stress UspA family protein
MTAESPGRPIIVGYDGRAPSERALTRAIDEAAASHSRVLVIVVAALPVESVDPYQPGAVGMGHIPPIPEDGPAEAQPLLEKARRRLAEAGVDGNADWKMGNPASELLRAAQENNARAIVVGAHHHSALARLFGADTASDLVREASCEVLVEH